MIFIYITGNILGAILNSCFIFIKESYAINKILILSGILYVLGNMLVDLYMIKLQIRIINNYWKLFEVRNYPVAKKIMKGALYFSSVFLQIIRITFYVIMYTRWIVLLNTELTVHNCREFIQKWKSTVFMVSDYNVNFIGTFTSFMIFYVLNVLNAKQSSVMVTQDTDANSDSQIILGRSETTYQDIRNIKKQRVLA